MYVSTISFCAKPDVSNEQTMEIYHALTAELRRLDGLQGSSLLLSENTHRGMAVFYWADAKAARAGGEHGMPLLLERVHDLVTEPPHVSGYELVHHDLSATA